MGIYTGGMRMYDEKVAAAKRIAKQQAKAEAGETKRKGRAGIFGKLGGLAMGTLAVGALGLTGGLAAPLVMGLASSLGKKWADEASKGGKGAWFGDTFKTSGQVKKIEAGGKYGYGREEAASLTKGLEESRKTEFDLGTVATDVGSSYLSAGLSGGLSGAGKTLMSGKEGSLMESLTGHAAGEGKFGIEGMKHAVGTALGGTGEVTSDADDFLFEAGESAGYAHPSTFTPSPQVASDIGQSDAQVPFINQQSDDQSWIPGFQQGGQVPQMDQHTMIGLALLSQMQQQQQQTAYSGTPLEEKQQPSSIADHFASQGKTLGGNNTQSLSQILGR